MDLVEKLREDRKSPNILRLKVLKIRGERPDVNVFIYEGVEDVAVYEVWISRIDESLAYEPVPGAGKEQVLSFYEMTDGQDWSRNIFFFVDRDFDEAGEARENVYELPAYSIENLLCGAETLESILKDEFRCAGSLTERTRIVGKFSQVQSEFRRMAADINFQIFSARREKIRVLKKPNDVADFADISSESAIPKFAAVKEVCFIEDEIPQERIDSLRAAFDLLPVELRTRGKYELDFFRRWLRLLDVDRKCAAPTLFSSTGRVEGEPSSAPLRRLATAAPVPAGLRDFVRIIGRPDAPGGGAASPV